MACFAGVGLLLAFACTRAAAAETKSIMAAGYYAREAADGPWRIEVTGSVPSLCGACLLVYDTEGRIVHKGVVPHGDYGTNTPFVVTIPKDGIAGDYLIKIIGHQRDLLGIRVPLTTLPGEVYGGSNFTIGHDKDRRVAFQVDKAQETVTLAAYKGHLSVQDDAGELITDTRFHADPLLREKHPLANSVKIPVKAGVTYWIIPESFYFGCEGLLYLTFDPARWFKPDPKLDEVEWWRN
jgi:hypothetical protein